MQLEILVRGQSNAILFMEGDRWAAAARLAAEVQRLLGFDGKADTVGLLYERVDDTSSTAYAGSAFLGEWMRQAPDGTWQPGEPEQGLLRFIAGHPHREAASTAVLWFHSEYDSRRTDLTAEEWTAAVRQDAALVRQALGGDAARIPYHFVSAHPYGSGSDAGHQAIRLGMERLTADPAFNARIAARALDIDAALDDQDGDWRTTEYGGSHISQQDAMLIADRAARAIAEGWAAHAKPGSPVALAGGDIDDAGPRVVAAERIAPDTLHLTVAQDHGGGFAPPGQAAARGLGWSVLGSGGGALEANAVQVLGPQALQLHFPTALPDGGVLHYGWGYGRLAEGNAPGQGNALYDLQGLPVWTPAQGVPITAPAEQHGALDLPWFL